MVRYLDKRRELELLPVLFDLLYENMKDIAPFSGSFTEERNQWVRCIAEAVQKEPRKLLLLYREKELVGFCMYYINGGKLMVEEMQIRNAYQRTSIAAELFRFLKRNLMPDTEFVEAFADQRNRNSRQLMERHGMKPIGETPDGSYIHYRGALKNNRNHN